MSSFAIGVDLGGTNLRVAAIDDSGSTLEIISTPANIGRGREPVIDEIAAATLGLAGRFRGSHRLLGIGVGIPGIIDLASGTVCSAANLPGWTDYPVQKHLEAKLGAAVILENDANCAALGEKWVGAGRHADDLCMLTLGTGVGGAFVFHGLPWHGTIGMAGELGHLTVFPDGRACACGNRGCLEQYASATAIQNAALEAIAGGHAANLQRAQKPGERISARAVFQCALEGDPVARQIFDDAGRALGIVLANLINALNLSVYVIGGGLSQAWQVFSPALFQELRRRSIVFCASEQAVAGRPRTLVTPALLRENSGLIGAARLPMIMAAPRDARPLAV
jgi:glucokinase